MNCQPELIGGPEERGNRKAACFRRTKGPSLSRMQVPETPVLLSPEKVAEVAHRLSELRHGVNNHLSLVVAATELVRRKPEMSERALDTLSAQPQKISDAIHQFSVELEKLIGLRRP